MSDKHKYGWLSSGTYLQRAAKESVIIFPVALIMSFYGSVRYSDRIDLSPVAVVVFAIILTVCLSSYFAHRSRHRESSRETPVGPPESQRRNFW
jgi:hypothetical protein